MANFKVPSQAASGGDSFSDALVGNQITNGSNQMTGGNFAVETVIPEKDSKEFRTQPFSEFITLDDINNQTPVVTNGSTPTTTSEIRFNNDSQSGNRSLYGSLKQRIGVAVNNIISKYPAAVLVDTSSPIGLNKNSAENAVYDNLSDTTEFRVQYSLFYNPLDVVLITPKSNTLPTVDNSIRNFYSSYTQYVIDLSGATFNIVSYSEPNSSNIITLRVGGNPFNGSTGFTESYLIRPNNGVVEQFYAGLDDLEQVLINRSTNPKFNAAFNVPRDSKDGSVTETITIYANWPVSRDGWNIQILGLGYSFYIEQLTSIADEVDEFKSNLIIRFLTSPQLYEFDTDDKKIESIFQIYGQSFDKVKAFIDNIAYMRNVTYDGINNIPDVLLKNLSETLGMSTINLFDEKSLQDSLYTRHNVQYSGISNGVNLVEAEFEFYRRLLVNLANLYKSKGTRSAIEFFLKFIGAPEPMIRLDEYIYKVDSVLPSSNVEADIRDTIMGVKTFNYVEYNSGTTGYTLTQISGSTTLSRAEYPVDEETGLPRKATSSDGSIFFQTGAGWYKKTLDHRSPDILDVENSDLTSRVKTIKTMSKPFTYGEDYFDVYRQLPGLDYGYDLSAAIDNTKTEVVVDESISHLTLNRKNINVFLSADRAIDYDIYRKSRDLSLNFGVTGSTMMPATGVTFAEFLNQITSEIITNSHVIRYKNQYTALAQVYNRYQQSVGFTPYHYIAVEEFINRLSPYWINIIDQFIPATTLWMGGNVIENGTFNRSKFKHRQPCLPTSYTELLYPDFETVIQEDLETIIAGGTLAGEDNSSNFRGVQLFSGVTFNIILNVRGTIYSGSTVTLKPFSGYTVGNVCTILESSPDYIPLICSYGIFNGGDSVDDIKLAWKNTLTGITSTINSDTSETGYTITADFFIDTDGDEKVKFTIISNDYYSHACDNIFEYNFVPFYETEKQECDLQVAVSQEPNIILGDPSGCQLQTNLIFNVSNNVGDETGLWPTYIRTGTTHEINEYPIEHVSGCTYRINGVKETTRFGMMFSDAGNCTQKIVFDGLQLVIIEASPGVSGFTSSPIIEYLPSYNYGLSHGTVVYRVMPTATLPLTYQDLQSELLTSDIVEIRVEDVLSGYTLLSVELKSCELLSPQQFKNAPIDGFQFAFDYKFVYVNGIDVAGTVKSSFINDLLEIEQNTKVLVYTNIDANLQTIPPTLLFKYPEDLYLGDLIINEFGFTSPVTGVTLDLCSEDAPEGIIYQINYSGSSGTNILLNGDDNFGNKFIVSYVEEEIDELSFDLHQSYLGNPPIYDPRGLSPSDPVCV